MSRCVRFLVAGRVQGVAYRASTQSTARRLRLCGFARNLPDGRVEVVACGEPERLQELERWLWRGPSFARVSEVRTEELGARSFVDFDIL